MNNSGSAGESSCKRQENGDASTGSERPLKKARFAWQVKGKYHLKNETSNCSSSIRSESDNPGSSSKNDTIPNDLVGTTEQNLEILGDYLLKQDFNTLDSVIADDKSLMKPSPSISSENLEYPRYVCSTENSGSRTSSSTSEHMSIPMSMVVSNNYSEDQCIARWQARQMAKGFVDNTINRVLDSWMIAPLPTDMANNRVLALDVAEFINNLPGDNIENEGILMAISAHGLQNTSSSCSNNNEPTCTSSKEEGYASRSSSPVQSDDDPDPMNNNSKLDSHSIDYINDINDLAWSYEEERDSNNTPFSFFPYSSSTSYLNYSDNERLQNSNIDFDDGNATGNDYPTHYDFMDAAVSFAIQNKGLTSFGTDYG